MQRANEPPCTQRLFPPLDVQEATRANPQATHLFRNRFLVVRPCTEATSKHATTQATANRHSRLITKTSKVLAVRRDELERHRAQTASNRPTWTTQSTVASQSRRADSGREPPPTG